MESALSKLPEENSEQRSFLELRSEKLSESLAMVLTHASVEGSELADLHMKAAIEWEKAAAVLIKSQSFPSWSKDSQYQLVGIT